MIHDILFYGGTTLIAVMFIVIVHALERLS